MCLQHTCIQFNRSQPISNKLHMRTRFIFLLILSALISSKLTAQPSLSNLKGLTTSPIPYDNYSKELRGLFNAFLSRQSQIERIKYNATRIDTLLNGSVRNNTGKVILERDRKDSVLKICFLSKADSMDFENIYINYTNYEVFTQGFYHNEPVFRNHIFGSPGGQMVVTDLLDIDTTHVKYSLSDFGDNNFIYKSEQDLGPSIRTKVLIIDKKTLIPIQVSSVLKSKNQSWRQSTSYFIKDVLINDQIGTDEHVDISFLSKYSSFENPADVLANRLVGKKVPEIVFQTFDNKTVKIRDLESKVVLLDFWELWCKPCIKALPAINEIAAAYEPFGLFTIGIATDDIDKAKTYVRTKEIGFVQAIGNDKLKSLLKVNAYPTYVLIDRKGVLKGFYFGYSDKIKLDINDLLFE